MLETEIQRQILDWLTSRRIWHRRLSIGAVKVKGARRKNPLKGFPDIFGILPDGLGRMFVIEVKTKSGRLKEEQLQCRAELEAKGVVYILARSLDDAMTLDSGGWP